jgi:putative ABC transport system permease protein
MMSFIPALPLGHGVAFLVKKASRLPMYLTWELALFVFVLSLLMSLISGVLALGKVRKAAPADLF